MWGVCMSQICIIKPRAHGEHQDERWNLKALDDETTCWPSQVSNYYSTFHALKFQCCGSTIAFQGQKMFGERAKEKPNRKQAS